jgi:hypothetical protein
MVRANPDARRTGWFGSVADREPPIRTAAGATVIYGTPGEGASFAASA